MRVWTDWGTPLTGMKALVSYSYCQQFESLAMTPSSLEMGAKTAEMCAVVTRMEEVHLLMRKRKMKRRTME